MFPTTVNNSKVAFLLKLATFFVYYKNLRISMAIKATALHRGLSKYLTAQDTHGTPTLTKHNRSLARLGYLLSLKPWSTIKVYWVYFRP